jgi:hypothetical protein
LIIDNFAAWSFLIINYPLSINYGVAFGPGYRLHAVLASIPNAGFSLRPIFSPDGSGILLPAPQGKRYSGQQD